MYILYRTEDVHVSLKFDATFYAKIIYSLKGKSFVWNISQKKKCCAKGSDLGAVQRKKFQKSEITMEVGG